MTCSVHGNLSGNLSGNSLALVHTAIYAADAGSAALAASGVGTVLSGLIAAVDGGIHTVYNWANTTIETAIAQMPPNYQTEIANAIAANQWAIFVDAIKDYVDYSGINHRISNDVGNAVKGAGLPWWLASAMTGAVALNIAKSRPGDAGGYNTWHDNIMGLFGVNQNDKRILPPGVAAGTSAAVMPYAAKVFATRAASGLSTDHALIIYSTNPAEWTTAGAASKSEASSSGSMLPIAIAGAALLAILAMRKK